jgi:hypothetical protein
VPETVGRERRVHRRHSTPLPLHNSVTPKLMRRHARGTRLQQSPRTFLARSSSWAMYVGSGFGSRVDTRTSVYLTMPSTWWARGCMQHRCALGYH